MNDIQKAIDEGKITSESWLADSYEGSYLYTPEQLKSLLEQVAFEAYDIGVKDGYVAHKDFKAFWAKQNLTFNED